MRHFPGQPEVTTAADSGGSGGPIFWTDFAPEALPVLSRLRDLAEYDEWWTWPEAIAWVGSRDNRNIASLRYWATEWSLSGDADVTLGAQHYMATQWCASARVAEDDLHRAIERGDVRTVGRTVHDGLASGLAKEVWLGGAVVYSGGAARLVSAKSKTTPWAFDIAVNRADLVATFPLPDAAEAVPDSSTSASTIPTETVSVSTGAAEAECKAWLAAAFVADPDHRRNKHSFRSDALTRFAGRLSLRGFNDRVWPELAREHERNSAGAKKKS